MYLEANGKMINLNRELLFSLLTNKNKNRRIYLALNGILNQRISKYDSIIKTVPKIHAK